LPLAIELAAVRVRLLPPEAMLGHLEQRLALLTHGAHDLPKRQQTVRATIDWSYQLLEEHDRELLARMSVFAGGATLPAIVQVCAPGDDEIEVIDRLQSLAENSLISAHTDPAGQERFRMLDLIREFAHDCVANEGEIELLGKRHGEFFAAFADQHGPTLASPELVEGFQLFDADYANIREALAWARATGNEELELRLLDWLGDYWYFRGYYPESWPWFEHALALTGPPPERRATLLRGAGNMRVRMGDIAGARELFQSSLDICEQLGDADGAAKSLSGLEGCYAKTEEYELADEAGSRALEIVRDLGDRRSLSFAASNAGYTAMQRGDLARARPMFEEAAEIAESLGDPEAISLAQQNLGLLLVFENDLDRAAEISAIGLRGAVELREHLGILAGLVAFAAIRSRRSDHEGAAHLLGLIEAELRVRGYVLDPVEARLRDETLELIAAGIGSERMREAMSAGATRDLIQVAAQAVA
jgi:tetratricopeptide (TPR) repeat protein